MTDTIKVLEEIKLEQGESSEGKLREILGNPQFRNSRLDALTHAIAILKRIDEGEERVRKIIRSNTHKVYFLKNNKPDFKIRGYDKATKLIISYLRGGR